MAAYGRSVDCLREFLTIVISVRNNLKFRYFDKVIACREWSLTRGGHSCFGLYEIIEIAIRFRDYDELNDNEIKLTVCLEVCFSILVEDYGVL